MSFVSTRIPEGNSCIVNLVNDYFSAAIEGLFTLLKRKLKLKLLFLNLHIHQPPLLLYVSYSRITALFNTDAMNISAERMLERQKLCRSYESNAEAKEIKFWLTYTFFFYKNHV